MKFKFDASFYGWDYGNDTSTLPKGIEKALKSLLPLGFIHMFSDVCAAEGYCFVPNGGTESDDFETIDLFKVYQENDDLFDWINGEKEEPEFIEMALSLARD